LPLHLVQDSDDPLVHLTMPSFRDAFFGSEKSPFKPAPLHGLKKVIEGVGIERAQRVTIVRGYKDRGRHAFGANLAQHFKAVHLGHLNVEQYKIRLLGEDCVDRRLSIPAFPNDQNLRTVFQETALRRAKGSSSIIRVRILIAPPPRQVGPRRGPASVPGSRAGRIPPWV